MTKAPGWDLYRSFLSVLREGSLSAAARVLSLTQPTMGRHIAELERSLGAPLFARSPSGLVPTEAALGLVPHAEAMSAAADAFVRAASAGADEPKGAVRVTASEFIGSLVLPRMLTHFRNDHPGIAIELSLSNRNEDLLRHEADLAVRMAPPTQSALVARHIGKVRIGLFAHRDYLRRHGMPRDLGELVAHHTLVGFDRDAAAIRGLRQTGMPVTRALFALRTDSDCAQFEALRAGFGIGGCQAALAAREPSLVAVLPAAFGFELGMWLVMHEDLRASRRVRLLFDHLARSLADYVASGRRNVSSRRGGQGRDDVLYPRTLRDSKSKTRKRFRGVEQSGSSSGS
jgi:DNA-binding transcriptional LysR family regulator